MHLDYNAGESDSEKFCTREDLVWAMILTRVLHIDDEIFRESEQDYSEVINRYSNTVRMLSGRFEIISRINGDYYRYRLNNPGATYAKYAEYEWEQYADVVETFDCPDRIKKQVVKILIETVLRRYNVIHGIQREMGI